MAHRLSCSVACGIFLDQGSNPCSLHWQADSYPLHHQGSPQQLLYKLWDKYFWGSAPVIGAQPSARTGTLDPWGIGVWEMEWRCSVSKQLLPSPVRKLCLFHGRINKWNVDIKYTDMICGYFSLTCCLSFWLRLCFFFLGRKVLFLNFPVEFLNLFIISDVVIYLDFSYSIIIETFFFHGFF